MTAVFPFQPRWRDLSADLTDTRLSLTDGQHPLIDLRLERGDTLELHLQDGQPGASLQGVWAACY